MKVTKYFLATRIRPDRCGIRDEWIERVIAQPLRTQRQTDGRVRCWASIAEADGRYLRVVLLEDAETVHNAFFDRDFIP
ncbi:MAG: hypothetical protein CVV15_09650 [Gammaproteobacteria bacterium HGW-Gammaproteobacteria-5]|nr:MAG: hypothetical protein CVV15_09650 [Gammaproteobacteria bacterium HGW-Gammaproteobacteria-5]